MANPNETLLKGTDGYSEGEEYFRGLFTSIGWDVEAAKALCKWAQGMRKDEERKEISLDIPIARRPDMIKRLEFSLGDSGKRLLGISLLELEADGSVRDRIDYYKIPLSMVTYHYKRAGEEWVIFRPEKASGMVFFPSGRADILPLVWSQDSIQ